MLVIALEHNPNNLMELGKSQNVCGTLPSDPSNFIWMLKEI
jgi:hypothetical protein